MIRWSFTALDTFLNTCAWQAYRRFVLRDVEDKGRDGSRHGDRSHDHFAKRLSTERVPLPIEYQWMEPVMLSLERGEWTALGTEYNIILDEQMQRLDNGYSGYWIWFKADVLARKPLPGPASVEDGIFYETALLIDWKTGNPKYEKPLQLQLGAALTFQAFPRVQKVMTFNYWTQKRGPGKVMEYTRDQAQELWRHILSLYLQYDRAARQGPAGFPKRENPLCRFCPVMDCEHNKVGQPR